MKLFIIRLLLIAIFYLLLHLVGHYDKVFSLLAAYVITYIFEPLIVSKI